MTQHAAISYIKSTVRIFGYALILVSIPTAMLVLIVSELIGIVEEIGE